MANYQKNISLGGSWAKTAELLTVKTAVIVSETNPMPSSFLDKNNNPKTQDVCKVMFNGNKESLNVSLNRATINGLVDAFGEDSKDWMNKPLLVEIEKMRVSGRVVYALYLIPRGYKKIDDQNGYAVILKDGQSASALSEDEINAEQIPF